MKALIFAAGLGTRLKPITDRMPKALVPVCGQPLLWYIVEKLKGEGFKSVVVNVHHFAEQIREYVASCGGFGIDVQFSDETDLLRETGGGIRYAAPLLNDGEPFLIHNVDILSNLNIKEFVNAHICKGADKVGNLPIPESVKETYKECAANMPLATLLVSDRQTQRYLLFNADGNLAAWMNIKTGEVRSPYKALQRAAGEGAVFGSGAGYSSGAGSNADVSSTSGTESEYFDWKLFISKYNLKKYAFDGAHIISPQIFELMAGESEKFSIIDFYLKICSRYNIKYHIQPELEMIDVGKLDSLRKAEDFLIQQGLQSSE